MNIAGVGPAELLVILIIALVVFGPQRLPQVAKDLGENIGKWRQALSEIQSVADGPMKEVKELREALDPTSMEKELKEALDPASMEKELKEALDPASMEKKLQESVQRMVTPEQQDQEKADHEVEKQVEKPEGPEAKDE
ncbi:MAG: twin-arginine translocase TatA/TatE family subunit [Anaerolineae bacterium]|nr:twin-arginine translocase TatA/TatE family subunit [Anaerolineae bacterium]